MQTKTLRNLLITLVALIFAAGLFSGGMIVGWVLPKHPSLILAGPSPLATPLPSSRAPTSAAGPLPFFQAPAGVPDQPANLADLFKPFWEAWDIVHEQYVDQPVDDVQLMRGAIDGMLSSLGDKHTSYMDPDEYRQANIPLSGEYEGIGAWVDATGDFLVITGPMPGSPAEKAGLKTGDKIVAVDDQDMTGVDPNLVLRKVLGPAGTTVKLGIQRSGQDQPFDVSIVRATITIPSVESKMLDHNVAYVRLNTFAEGTKADLHQALQDLMARNPAGLVLDLRYNGGGYLTTAIEVVSEFIPSGKVVMYEVQADGSRQTFAAEPGGLATTIPLVVLVNEGTASASEITAGAIQDYQRGTLVGVTTYGKGSVQNWIPLQDDQGAVRVTIAHWLTPKERQINDVGLKPDVEVELTDAAVQAGSDPQLDKAIEILTAPK